MDLRNLLEAGHAQLQAEHKLKEQKTAGHPRVGSIGIVTPAGEVHGICSRIALSRSMGIEPAVGESQGIMFRAGEANEDNWTRVLEAAHRAGTWTGKLLRHDEVAVKHAIPGVTLDLLGHPDIVFANDAGVPEYGLELKGIFGYRTGMQVYFDHRPKNENLIQAAGYSYFKGIKYALCYTSANWIKLNFYDAKKYGMKNILPFNRVFYMEWRDEVLWYRDETQNDWVQTKITPKAIEAYYQLVQRQKDDKQLGPRPNADYVDGTPHKYGPGSDCTYCVFNTACNRYDMNRDYDAWVDDIAAVVELGGEIES